MIQVGAIQAMIKFLRRIWRGVIGKFVCIILCLWIFVAALSFVWTPYSLLETNGYEVWQKPSLKHWLGTDGTGADMLSWLMAGSRVEILLVISTVAIASVVGFVILSFTICRVQKIRSVSIMAVDALISIPTVLIALMLAVPLGASVLVIMLACGFGYGLNLARILRPSAVLVLKSNYVDCAVSNAYRFRSAFAFCRNCYFSGKRIDLFRCWCSFGSAELGSCSFYFGYFDSRLSACGSMAWPCCYINSFVS